jgi:hypothetical protein
MLASMVLMPTHIAFCKDNRTSVSYEFYLPPACKYIELTTL